MKPMCPRESYSSSLFSTSTRYHIVNGLPLCNFNNRLHSRNHANSQEEIENSALQFLERRKSTDLCSVG